MNHIFIGYDHRQPIAHMVLESSIITRAQAPVAVTPLLLHQLPIERTGLTPFTFTRFLVPWLMEYQGWALFLDADMLVLEDINQLFDMKDESKAVMVVKNKERFEWASLMLFNCGHPDNRLLTPEHIEKANALHSIGWTEAIGELPHEWNHIVLYDEPRPDAKLVHYTGGVPVFEETQGCEYSNEWQEEARYACSAMSWAKLMGQSKHVERVMAHMHNRLRAAE